MFGSIGGTEVLLLFALALLLFGPRKLPEIGRTLGKTVSEFRRATLEFKSSLEREVEVEKLKETAGSLRDASRAVHPVTALRSAVGEAVESVSPRKEPPAESPRDGVPSDPA